MAEEWVGIGCKSIWGKNSGEETPIFVSKRWVKWNGVSFAAVEQVAFGLVSYLVLLIWKILVTSILCFSSLPGQELREWLANPTENLQVAVGDNIRVWVVTLTGAKGTIFAGEKYKLKVKIS